MRHGRNKKILNMSSSHRDAVISNLMVSLVKCGKIETTLAKAHVLAPYIEKLITKAKTNNLATTKYIASSVDKGVVRNVYELAAKFANRKGGYTRIVKTWRRYGDAAKTAIVEFVE